jgi:hypothetical protein
MTALPDIIRQAKERSAVARVSGDAFSHLLAAEAYENVAKELRAVADKREADGSRTGGYQAATLYRNAAKHYEVDALEHRALAATVGVTPPASSEHGEPSHICGERGRFGPWKPDTDPWWRVRWNEYNGRRYGGKVGPAGLKLEWSGFEGLGKGAAGHINLRLGGASEHGLMVSFTLRLSRREIGVDAAWYPRRAPTVAPAKDTP